MAVLSDAFEKNYQEYLNQIAAIDFGSIENKLGIAQDGGRRFLHFFNHRYTENSLYAIGRLSP